MADASGAATPDRQKPQPIDHDEGAALQKFVEDTLSTPQKVADQVQAILKL